MWILEFRYGFCCILLIVLVHVGRFTPQNWFCLKTIVSGMRNGDCTFSARCDLSEGAPFSQETQVLQGHLSQSLINEIESGFSPSCGSHVRHRHYLGIYMHAYLSAEVDILLGFFFLLWIMANVSSSWRKSIHALFLNLLGKKERGC